MKKAIMLLLAVSSLDNLEAHTTEQQLIQNGNFAISQCTTNWCIFKQNNRVRNWTPKPEIQIGYGNIYNSRLGRERVIELAPNTNSCIEQNVRNLLSGVYQLKYEYAARQGRAFDDCQFKVTFNDRELRKTTPSDYNVQTDIVQFEVRQECDGRVEFCGIGGSNNSFGAIIRTVSLIRKCDLPNLRHSVTQSQISDPPGSNPPITQTPVSQPPVIQPPITQPSVQLPLINPSVGNSPNIQPSINNSPKLSQQPIQNPLFNLPNANFPPNNLPNGNIQSFGQIHTFNIPSLDKNPNINFPSFGQQLNLDLPPFSQQPNFNLPPFNLPNFNLPFLNQANINLPSIDPQTVILSSSYQPNFNLPLFGQRTNLKFPSFDKQSNFNLPPIVQQPNFNLPSNSQQTNVGVLQLNQPSAIILDSHSGKSLQKEYQIGSGKLEISFSYRVISRLVVKQSALYVTLNGKPIYKVLPVDSGQTIRLQSDVAQGTYTLGFSPIGSPNEAEHQVSISNVVVTQQQCIASLGKDLIVNGGFQQNQCGSNWCIWNQKTGVGKVTGWQPKPEIEVGRGTIYNPALGKSWVVELDSNVNTCIQQKLDLKPGRHVLKFDWAARIGKGIDIKTNQFQVKLNEKTIKSFKPTDVQVNKQQIEFDLGECPKESWIEFCGTGKIDGLGALVDNIKLFRVDRCASTKLVRY